MNEPVLNDRLLFHVHFIRTPGRKRDPTIRVLMAETTNTRMVYEGFVSWTTCRLWISRLESKGIPTEELAAVCRLLDRRKLATIQGVWASPYDFEILGLRRADS